MNIIFTLFFLLFIASFSLDISQTDEIDHGRLDVKSYNYFTLPNSLPVLLVLNPTATVSSVGMDVGVGYSSDPQSPVKVSGLAHFCEHMLFLGTKEFPKEDFFSTFVIKNGGQTNAYTRYISVMPLVLLLWVYNGELFGPYSLKINSLSNTNYYYSIQHPMLKRSLKIFNSFFQSPLFTSSAANREVNAINAEHLKNIPQDDWRIMQILKGLANEGHPFNKFGTGNTRTLTGESMSSLHSKLISFWEDHYWADNMRLVIETRLENKDDEKELKDYIIKTFSHIRSRNKHPKSYVDSYYEPLPLYSHRKLPLNITIGLIGNKPLLMLLWEIGPLYKSTNTAAITYLSFLIETTYEKGLYRTLKEKGWIYSISLENSPSEPSFNLLSINIGLTNKGLSRVAEIVAEVFRMISLIKSRGVTQSRYEEFSQIARLHFDLSTDGPSPSELGESLHWYHPKDILTMGALLSKYDAEVIMGTLKYLTPKNLIMVIGKPHVDNLGQVEPFYNVHYSTSPISPHALNYWNKIVASCELDTLMNKNERAKSSCERLSLPAPNSFLPIKVEYPSASVLKLAAMTLSFPKPPQKILSADSFRGWFMEDRSYLYPSATLRLHIITPSVESDTISHLKSRIIIGIINDLLESKLSDAAAVGYLYEIKLSAHGLNILISGLPDRLPLFMKEIMDLMLSEWSSSGRKGINHAFDRVRVNLKQEYLSHSYSPAFAQADYFIKRLLLDRSHDIDTLKEMIDRVTLGDVIAHHSSLFESFSTEALISGKLLHDEAISILRQIQSRLEKRPHANVNADSLIPNRLISIQKSFDFGIHNLNSKDNNQCFIQYYQGDLELCAGNSSHSSLISSTLSCAILTEALSLIVDKNFFHELRTKRQFGYIVFSGNRNFNYIPGFFFLVQSAQYSPNKMAAAFESFKKKMLSDLSKISEDEIRTIKTTMIDNRSRPPKTFSDAVGETWSRILKESYLFDHREREIEIIKRLSKKGLIDFYKKMISSNKRRINLSIWNRWQNHQPVHPYYSPFADPGPLYQ